MTSFIDAVLPYPLTEKAASSSSYSSQSDSSPVDAVIFAGISLLLGAACRQLFHGTRVPYTVVLLVIGLVFGSLEYGTNHNLGKIGNGIRIWNDINPDLLLAVFLPALLFESSFSMDVHQIKRCIGQMVLLAGPGVLISTLCIGSLLKFTFPYDWDWRTSFLLGGLLGATDPVAVVAMLKELGASKKLTTIIDGESVMNDGVSVVVFQLFFKMVMGHNSDWGSIIKFLAQNTFGAVGIGLAFGIASVLWLRFVVNDTVVEITVTLSVSYFAYYTAQEWAGVSGILTVMILGMFYAFARTAFRGESHQSLHQFWEMAAYIANTLVFVLSGVVIAEGVLSSQKISYEGRSWYFLFLLYLYVQFSRCVVVGALYPLLRRFGYGLDWKEAIIITWSGLRGAVSLSLALSVNHSSGNSYLSSETGTRFLFFTGGIVFLTLVVNGSTTQPLLHLLRMDPLTATKKRILEFTKYEMFNTALKAIEDLGDDEELGSADWPTLKRYISSLNDLEKEPVHPHRGYESDNLDPTNLKDIRIRLLNGVQKAYWLMLDEGRLTQNTANVLIQSVDETLDLLSTDSLCDWRGLKSHVRFPSYYKFFQSRIIPRKMVAYLIVDRLESAFYISAAFIRAHKMARQQLHDFLGNSSIVCTVINESEVEGEEAKQFLDDIRASYPQILRILKTRQVTHSVLNHLTGYIKNLEKVGMLEEEEVSHLHDILQSDSKKLLRNPCLVKLPNLSDLITTHPLLASLPSAISERLKHSSRETMKPRGSMLYSEGSTPNGIWLISNGTVKCGGKNISTIHSSYPSFSLNTTLGVYEVLSGKPYVCDMITDSFVFCFFIESETILSSLQSDSAIEDLLWQESALVLAKLLLPQIFEITTIQEMRGITSKLTTYVSGETIKVAYNHVGLLLEGSIKQVGLHNELITPPAPLFLGNQNQNSHDSSGFSHQETIYVAESRAKVIIFELRG